MVLSAHSPPNKPRRGDVLLLMLLRGLVVLVRPAHRRSLRLLARQAKPVDPAPCSFQRREHLAPLCVIPGKRFRRQALQGLSCADDMLYQHALLLEQLEGVGGLREFGTQVSSALQRLSPAPNALPQAIGPPRSRI